MDDNHSRRTIYFYSAVLLSSMYWGTPYPGGKWPRREAPSTAKTKNLWNCTSVYGEVLSHSRTLCTAVTELCCDCVCACSPNAMATKSATLDNSLLIGWSQWPCVLTPVHWLRPLEHCNPGFESHSRYGCLSAFVLCCSWGALYRIYPRSKETYRLSIRSVLPD
jgi:hypothetical protein